MAAPRPGDGRTADRARRWAAVGALLAAVAGVLAPLAAAGFVYDDRVDAIDNPAATPEGFAAALGVTNRPLVKASYALQRAATGAAPRPFHLLNLALHLASTVLVFALVRRMARGLSPERAEIAAWGAAALWALHPAAVESVAPVAGRSVLLSTVLVLGALLLATRDGPVSWPRGMAVALLAFAAPLARETALVLPALLLLWQATLGAGEGREHALGRQLPALAGAALAALAIGASDRHRELIAFSLASRSPLEALRGNVHALFEIVALWLVPGRLSVDPAAPADLGWSAPATLVRVVLLALAAGFVVVARRRRPAAAFAIGWTLLALLPANSLLWRLDPVSPRPLYLASFGLVLALALAARASVVGAVSAVGFVSGSRRAIAPRAAALAVALGLTLGGAALAAHRRAGLWADPAALWADAALKSPARARPWLNLGMTLLAADRLDAAEVALGAALALEPGERRARCALDAIRIRRLVLPYEVRSSP